MKLNEITVRQKSIALSVLSGIGVVATGCLSARGAKKAEKEQGRKERVLAYLPAVVSGCATVACIGISTYITGEEIAGLSLALAATAQKFMDYRKAVHDNVDAEVEARINEDFYRQEIARLEQQLEDQSHPSEDDDLSTFIDSYSAYTFKARKEDVEEGLAKAVESFQLNDQLNWCDVFYFANNEDMKPHDCALGALSPNYDYGVGWSKEMLDDMYGDVSDIHEMQFDIKLTPIKGMDNAYSIDYTYMPEFYFWEY